MHAHDWSSIFASWSDKMTVDFPKRGSSSDSSSSTVSKKNKHQVSVSTFEKWQWQYDSDYQSVQKMMNHLCQHCGVKYANNTKRKSQEWETSPFLGLLVQQIIGPVTVASWTTPRVSSTLLLWLICIPLALKPTMNQSKAMLLLLVTWWPWMKKRNSEWCTSLKFAMCLPEKVQPSTNIQHFMNVRDCSWVLHTKEVTVSSSLPTTLLKLKEVFLQSLLQVSFLTDGLTDAGNS